MATTRIVPLHTGKGRKFGQAIKNVINYVSNPEKTENRQLITGFGCDSRSADAEFIFAKQEYIRQTGRIRGLDDVIAYHVRQAFVPGEITAEKANQIGVEFAKRFTKEDHAFVVCTHTDKAHIHNHIIWSAVNFECDRKFRNFWGSTRAVRELSDTICLENGLSIVENPKRHGLRYDEWLGDKKEPSHRELTRMAIDAALDRKPQSVEELFSILKEAEYEIERRGKSVTLKRKDWARKIRLSSLGKNYEEDQLEAVIQGKQDHAPLNKGKQSSKEKISLVVDIQKKLQEGKGAGYERWAKVFNLKQMAKSLNYLTANGLNDYGMLENRTKQAVEKYNALSDQIKAEESRMKEISELRTHIFRYMQTRSVYEQYRKAGYSKAFLAEHESEIILYKAAQAAFDKLNGKKIPSVKELQQEYDKLLVAKQSHYGEFREARSEMRQLLTVKENVDRILEIDSQKEKEASSPQREKEER